MLLLQFAHQHDLFHCAISSHNLSCMSDANRENHLVMLRGFDNVRNSSEIGNNPTKGASSLFYSQDSDQPFGASADLCALVRSVFELTQSTYDLAQVATAAQLDSVIKSKGQLSLWGDALRAAEHCDYDQLHAVLSRM